jgi:ABC-2 type transport system permease protein
MDKIWCVAVYEYRRSVFRKSFLITLLSVPLVIVLSVAFGLFIESRGGSMTAAGIVDLAGVMHSEEIPVELTSRWAEEYSEPADFIFFPGDDAARVALESGELQAYFILPENFLLTRNVEVVYTQEPDDPVWQQFYDLLRANSVSGYSNEVAQRVVSGNEIIVRSVDGRRQVPADSGPTFGLLMPLFIAAAVLAMLLIGSGYTTSAVADEKENRTMEILVTTISPTQLIAGKVLGIVAISLTLLLIWAVIVILGIFISRLVGIRWFNDIYIDWRSVMTTIAIGIPAYMLATALMVAIGSVVTTTQEGQSLSSIFFILHFLPLYINFMFFMDPHSPQAVLLSILPFTALMTVAMRNVFTIVPTWQVALSVLVQVLCTCGAVWLASRAFRIGMLRYGQRLSLRHLLARG